MNLRTANHNHRRRTARHAKAAAYAYDMARIERLSRAGRLDKRTRSGFVRRMVARSKASKAGVAR